MKRALFMTVGTGVGYDEERIQSLAHGLLESIGTYQPDKIVFFGSQLSKKTVKSLKNQYKERFGSDLNHYQFLTIPDVDHFDDCFQTIVKEIRDHVDYDVIIDYTSGTKTMTMSAAIASVLYHKKLTFISGKRGQNGLVSPKTEDIRTQNLYSVYDKLLFGKVKDAFNSYRFKTAEVILDEIVDLENRNTYQKLFQAYNFWDKFNHQEAAKIITQEDMGNLKDIKEILTNNKEFLGTLVNAKKIRGIYVLADLLNNTQRRFQEDKYDDALARLYRAVELIAQQHLQDTYQINTSQVDLDKVPETLQDYYERKRDRNGKITIGLREDYVLLHELDEQLGDAFLSDNRLKYLLQSRNNSILAHGLEPITGEKIAEIKELYEKTLQLGIMIYPNIEELMQKANFPNFRP